ncbi:thiosulfate sulfurtransferase PspE [Pragia fontium]|uniref:Phage shock protein E n=2 Tax=Pragia fontium TaxID=82985 RepID=A0AAJ4WBR9_9GAMM|nr:thiosulfate sulfurtransferase PspE [Pragia fontium]AKJ42960.1 thiosulfate:cyanide sulfurtransferase [Pragia fontium]SFD06884.1 phage shock protein E [Pragia fontium DSM 5563 = ATCC 49100]SUB83381.1 Thiosulfate sulfurtransferase PspE precursor [Pragia fontium]VEJ56276.1 Thiosulfate sulfurtransferase PspE precursor [Pragia fontium]GKX63961.1 thiosulfate sulfurtransferase PspE [Pragia fontium]
MFRQGLLLIVFLCSTSVLAAEYWIDVRIPEQYQSEHIQGAINIPLKQLTAEVASQVKNKDDTVHLYCNSGRQSGLAQQALLEMGYTNVLNEGGINQIAQPKISQ